MLRTNGILIAAAALLFCGLVRAEQPPEGCYVLDDDGETLYVMVEGGIAYISGSSDTWTWDDDAVMGFGGFVNSPGRQSYPIVPIGIGRGWLLVHPEQLNAL